MNAKLKRAAIMYAVVALILLSLTILVLATPGYKLHPVTYTVRYGDCLWSIASQFCPEGMNRWDYIYMVYEENGLTTSTLQPGQVLTVFRDS